MINFFKGMLFSIITVALFIAVMLMSFDLRDKKYFKDKGTIAFNEEKFNFFYGVYGYHTLTPSYVIENDDFRFYMYDIVTRNTSTEIVEFTEYVYMLFIPNKTYVADFQYLVFYNQDNTTQSVRLYQYMDFNMFNTYDDSFLISKEYLSKNNFKDIAFKDGDDEFYCSEFIVDLDTFNTKSVVENYYIDNNYALPELDLVDVGIYPQLTHVAEGYTHYIWSGFGVAIFLILALFGGVYLKPPFQKGKNEATKGMKMDGNKYTKDDLE